MQDFWVFGYGSLMWRPGFEVVDRMPAQIFGLHRALCVYSWVHRGTRERPGLVFGLDAGGSARGMALKVSGADRETVIDYLRARELVTNVYLEVERPIRLENGEKAKAITYIVDRTHPQYAGILPPERLLEQVTGAVGQSGANEEYIINTLAHLRELGIEDHKLEQLASRLT